MQLWRSHHNGSAVQWGRGCHTHLTAGLGTMCSPTWTRLHAWRRRSSRGSSSSWTARRRLTAWTGPNYERCLSARPAAVVASMPAPCRKCQAAGQPGSLPARLRLPIGGPAPAIHQHADDTITDAPSLYDARSMLDGCVEPSRCSWASRRALVWALCPPSQELSPSRV